MAQIVVAIVQARMGSKRLPGKVLKTIEGKPLIEILFHRLSRSKAINTIILATSEHPENDVLATTVETMGYDVFRGSEDDVLNRFYHAAKKYRSDIIVRITGDCPIIDPKVVDDVVECFINNDVDYASNVEPPTYPDGLDVEAFSFSALELAHANATSIFDREHVTPFIRDRGNFKKINFTYSTNVSKERWTVDTAQDFEVVQNICRHFSPNLDFNLEDVLNLRKNEPILFDANLGTKRNEGIEFSSGNKLWVRAKQIIPGGNMLLSKRPELFLPELWPTYYSKAKGCKVWDLDGQEYIDFSLMGVGTNILGYSHPAVDNAVHLAVDQGNMSTLNCPEEVQLAERLLDLHPWAGMVRFARAGGEANAIAVRIARAAAGKEKIAICGYHGWHDWYLSANLADDKNLDGHLLPGLEPIGVPRDLKGLVLPFRYNCFAEIEALVRDHKIGAIKMEVSRNEGPKDHFLQKVREIATQNNIVLIFDECTSGFRETFGGLHKKYGVEPDIAVFGKALGNGYPITAVIGRDEVMEVAQDTFISSTFWTERIGNVAGLKTLEIMEKERSWESITRVGSSINRRWEKLASKFNLPLEISGLPALTSFNIPSPNWQIYKTVITQEMLGRGFLATNTVYACTEHTPDLIDQYFEHLEPIFSLIAECEAGRPAEPLLKGPVSHTGFRRLN